MYSIYDFGKMIADKVRTLSYRQAIQDAVTPESIVVDLGCGTGIMSMLACQAGARRVYAIEINDAIEVARSLAAANGFANRIIFIQAMSTKVSLPERADIIIHDLNGVLPFHEASLSNLIDAQRRFLAPGGRFIPQAEALCASIISAPDDYQDIVSPWNDEVWGLDMIQVRQMEVNLYKKIRARPEQLLVPPHRCGTWHYASIREPNAQAEINWQITDAGEAHGLILWFDSIMGPGVTFSNAPGSPRVIYGQTFFPWPQPVRLASGDTVAVILAADLVGDDYTWRWETRILDREGRVKADFKQSTFFGALLAVSKLRQRAPGHIPSLTADGHIDRAILELMDGVRSLEEIARQVAAQFPRRFGSTKEALTRVGELSLRYGRTLDSEYRRDES